MAKLTRDAGESLEHDDLLQQMARLVLGGPKDDGRSGHQVTLTVCKVAERDKGTCGGRRHWFIVTR